MTYYKIGLEDPDWSRVAKGLGWQVSRHSPPGLVALQGWRPHPTGIFAALLHLYRTACLFFTIGLFIPRTKSTLPAWSSARGFLPLIIFLSPPNLHRPHPFPACSSLLPESAVGVLSVPCYALPHLYLFTMKAVLPFLPRAPVPNSPRLSGILDPRAGGQESATQGTPRKEESIRETHLLECLCQGMM